jgi:hypothetical protein
MSTQIVTQPQKTAMPTVVGIFNIIVGAFCLLGVLALIVAAAVAMPFVRDFTLLPAFVITLIAIPVLVIGVLSVVGGMYALQRRNWGWVLAGSIASALVSHLFGIVAIVLTALSKNEFNQ